MDKKTIKELNKLNKEFYLKTQEYFNRTRLMHWPGWEKLLPYLTDKEGEGKGKNLKVLDVACGNGRFGKWLKEKGVKIDYVGVDNNDYLLKEAKKAIPGGRFIKRDILGKWELRGKFEVIVLFGILHHVPGYEERMALLRKMKRYLNKEGLLILTFWQFKLLKRFRDRISVLPEKKLRLEKNDYILDWRKGIKAYRYAHFFNQEEVEKIVKELGLKLVASFEADAKQGRGNRYIILKAAS